MDFGSLLYEAQRNERSSNKDAVRCYKTTFEPPKKDSKGKSLSVNIKKFLQKKEEEERRKDVEAKKKREELVALRSQDKKATKRVQVMLKRTKSANKSVMEDAIDDVNTVVTMAGPAQPDEDDYGYVSQEASAYYNKLMDKYAHMPPEEPKFSQAKKTSVKDVKEMNAAKERVRQALNRVEEEEMMPHKRKRKSKADKSQEQDDFIDDNDYRQGSSRQEVEDEPPPKKPKRPMAPPPLDFNSLLKIAEQKQFEPIVIEKKVEEDVRPLTKKQRMEYEREKDWRMRKSEKESEKSSSRDSGNPKVNTNRIPKLSESQNRIPKLSESQNRIPKLSETQNRKNSSSGVMASRTPQSADRSSGDARKFQRDEGYERQQSTNHLKSRLLNQFDRGRPSSSSDNVERKRQRNSSGSDDDKHQPNNEYNNERRNSQVKFYNDKKRILERSEYQKAQYDNDSDNDRLRSKSNYGKPRQESALERKYPPAKSDHDHMRSSEYERSKKYDLDEGRFHESHEMKYEQNRSRGEFNRERQYSNSKLGREHLQSPESDRETSRRFQNSEDDRRSRQNSEMNRNKLRSEESYTRSRNYDSDDDRPRASKPEREKSRTEYDQNKRRMQMKSNYERKQSPDSNHENSRNYHDSDDDRARNSKTDERLQNSKSDNRPQNSKYDREKSRTEFDQNRRNYQMKSSHERRHSPNSNDEISRNYHESDDDRSRAVPSNHDRQKSDRNKIRSYENTRNYDSEDDRPPQKSDREKSRAEIQQSRHNLQMKLDREKDQSSDDRSKSHRDKVKTSSSSEQSKSRLLSDSERERKRIPPKLEQRKPPKSKELEDDRARNVSKSNQCTSIDSDGEKPRVNWKSDRERVPESQSRHSRNLDDERSKYNAERNRSQNVNKYDREKAFNRDKPKPRNDIKYEQSQSCNDSDYDRSKSSRKIVENNRDRSKPISNSQVNEQISSESRDRKVTTVPNAEERLKKNADVWSKPCNITPPRPDFKTVTNRNNGIVNRQNENSLSSKKIENRIVYNKSRLSTERSNSSPSFKSSPGTKSTSKEDNRSPSGFSDQKIVIGKPGPGGRPNLMKAAAVRAAELKIQRPILPPEKKNDRLDPPKSEGLSNNMKSKSTNEIKPRQFPPSDLKPKQFPPADLKPKLFPPKDVRPKQFPPSDVKRRPRPPVKRRIIEDSDEEHDSEMDDFIDDGPDETEDYSKYISEIFGYDKSRYSNLDEEDDECMESSFAQQMKEDIRSTKIGIMEDLEDMRKEKEEKMKALKKKMVSSKSRR